MAAIKLHMTSQLQLELIVDAPAEVKKAELTIPKSAIGAIAEGKIESMTISTPVATYNL